MMVQGWKHFHFAALELLNWDKMEGNGKQEACYTETLVTAWETALIWTTDKVICWSGALSVMQHTQSKIKQTYLVIPVMLEYEERHIHKLYLQYLETWWHLDSFMSGNFTSPPQWGQTATIHPYRAEGQGGRAGLSSTIQTVWNAKVDTSSCTLDETRPSDCEPAGTGIGELKLQGAKLDRLLTQRLTRLAMKWANMSSNDLSDTFKAYSVLARQLFQTVTLLNSSTWLGIVFWLSTLFCYGRAPCWNKTKL